MAFEASATSGVMDFTRYIDSMNRMIDAEEDVKLLRQNGIISNHLQSNEEVASLWNNMGKCVHLTKVEYLDNVIEDVNRYYNRKWKVVVLEFVNSYILYDFLFAYCGYILQQNLRLFLSKHLNSYFIWNK